MPDATVDAGALLLVALVDFLDAHRPCACALCVSGKRAVTSYVRALATPDRRVSLATLERIAERKGGPA